MAPKKSSTGPARKSGAKPSGPKSSPREAIRIRWERRNIALLGSGLAAILLGYILLSQGDITAAPVLLVLGYCVLVPLAFIL